MKLLLFSTLALVSLKTFSQSPGTYKSKIPVDTNVIANWQSVDGPIISNNGEYAFYTINNNPKGNNSLVIKATFGNWQKEISGISSYNAKFSEDNRLVIAKGLNDTLKIITLGTDKIESIPNVIAFKYSNLGDNQWLAITTDTAKSKLILRRINRQFKERSFFNVIDYSFYDTKNIILLQTEERTNIGDKRFLLWINLETNTEKIIWEGAKASNICFDNSRTQLAFISEETIDKRTHYSLWHFEPSFNKAIKIASNKSLDIEQNLVIDNSPISFIKNGEGIFFKLSCEKEDELIEQTKYAAVDVWSYSDAYLQPFQLKNKNRKRNYAAVFNLSKSRVILLERDKDYIISPVVNSQYILISHQDGQAEYWWRRESRPSISLVSLVNGDRKIVKDSISTSPYDFFLSPSGNFVIYFNRKTKKYLSYSVKTGLSINIGRDILTNLVHEDYDYPGEPEPVGIAGWFDQDTSLLVYDNYDIWKIDVAGKRPSLNITNGFGRAHNIKFRLVYENKNTPLTNTNSILLTAFNTGNKFNGFFLKSFSTKSNPMQLQMGPYDYYHVESQSHDNLQLPNRTFQPLKAKDADVWIVRRMNTVESPNYFITKNFKDYIPLSNVNPNKNINWMTAELFRWTTLEKKISNGILYKPENFDSTKKYPIIFIIYEQFSDRLYSYFSPKFTESSLNIPYFVSKGFLVFTPDIHYTIGNPGGSAYNSIISAALCLSKLRFVDSKNMAIAGHSFGGFETNYVITHSNLFTAAIEAAGPCDLVSQYGSLYDDERSNHNWAENYQGRLGATLWQHPELYIKNSPIILADRISTPLLMMNNKRDYAVLFSQAIEFYTALRRLEKKVWLLQYDNGNHGVGGEHDTRDYTMRISQFFDHYLKSAPAPTWMTRGIPARLKQIETGYAYDPSGNCGKDCKICKMWNEKMKKDSAATWKEIERRKLEEHWE